MATSTFYFQIPRLCVTISNEEIILVSNNDTSINLGAETELQFTYDYTCSIAKTPDYYCITVGITNKESTLDQDFEFRAVAIGTDGSEI